MSDPTPDICIWALPLALREPVRIPCASFPACECKSPSSFEGSPSRLEEASDCHPQAQSSEGVSP